MDEKLVCKTTHPQIAAGPCPWCERVIRDGCVTDASGGCNDAELRWNWELMADHLRHGDQEVRSQTLLNLWELANTVEKVLPLLAIALTDVEAEIRWKAEQACSRISRDLTGEQILWLEEQAGDPNRALAARIMLLNRYLLSKSEIERRRRAAHIHWIIESHPECDTAGSPYAEFLRDGEPAAYETAKALWLRQCAAPSATSVVLSNAAWFFFHDEPERAEELYLQAQTLDPDNPAWHERLAHLHSLSARFGPSEAREKKARQSLVELEMAEQIRSAHSGVSEVKEDQFAVLLNRVHSLPERAKSAFEAGEYSLAKEYAQEALELATSEDIPDYFRNDGNAIHFSNLVLGRVALRAGDTEQAKRHLLESGKTKGSPNLGSFGPNMSLAKELLEMGEVPVVLEYLELCRKFWEHDSGQIDEWQASIKKGKVPDFGGNLIY